jgi:hypothetical protein
MPNSFEVPSLGRLRTVDLREVWPSEPYSFTPWLAQAGNLQFLAETIGLPGLELVRTEQQVDIFSADIVARASDTGETVLIENQIERSDHIHLGQVLTYAAGLEAAIIVWVSKRFTEAHRAALDWLNRITTDQFAFFGVEVEAVQIGNSIPAPRFNVISRPNQWARSLRTVSHPQGGDQQTESFQFYWSGYESAAREVGAPIRVAAQQVRSTNYYVPALLRNAYYTAFRAVSKGRIGVYFAIYGTESEQIFEALHARRSEIESAFGASLEWLVQKEGAVYWIRAGRLDANADESDWPRQHAWLAQTMKRLATAVDPILATMDISPSPLTG